MGRVSRVVVVCEGFEDSAFARGFFNEAGLSREIQPRENPRGKSSGHDFVRKAFVEEVKNLQRFKEGRGVIGFIDEDSTGTEKRITQIDSDLRKLGLPEISASSGRCVLVPVRNLETWVYWLRANQENRQCQANETEDFKQRPPKGETKLEKKDFSAAGSTFHTLNPASLPKDCLPALGQARLYLRQFLDAVRR